jgi:predicted nucleic acid-binding Zn ribbon protein
MDSNLRRRVLHEWSGLPQAPDHQPKDLKSTFQRALSQLGLQDRLQEATLGGKWPQLVGPSLAVHCRPGIVRRGILTVYVDHPAWLHQITMAHKGDMLKAVQTQFAHLKVKDLQLRIGR